MQNLNTFLHRLPILMMALLLVATIGCKDDDDTKSTNCTTYSDLGEFSANFEMPYGDTLGVIDLVSEEDSTSLLSVNHPGAFDFYGLSPTATTTEVFDCEAFNSVKKYTWAVASKQALLIVVVDDVEALRFS